MDCTFIQLSTIIQGGLSQPVMGNIILINAMLQGKKRSSIIFYMRCLRERAFDVSQIYIQYKSKLKK